MHQYLASETSFYLIIINVILVYFNENYLKVVNYINYYGTN